MSQTHWGGFIFLFAVGYRTVGGGGGGGVNYKRNSRTECTKLETELVEYILCFWRLRINLLHVNGRSCDWYVGHVFFVGHKRKSGTVGEAGNEHFFEIFAEIGI